MELTLPRWEQLTALAIAVAPKLLAAILVLLVFWIILKLTAPALRLLLTRARVPEALTKLLVDGLYRGAIVIVAVIMAASQLGINVAAALAGLGIAGIALGFAAQETVANSISGFLIFWDRPFRVGDYITSQDKYGEVREITMRTTRIRTLENTYIVVPNKQLMGELLINHSMYGETRVNVPLGIAYKERIADARAALLQAVSGLEDVLAVPPPDVVAVGLGDSSVNLEVRVWIGDARLERPVFFRVLEASKVALDKAEIEIPFPHLQLFLEDVRDPVWTGAARLAGRALS